MKRKISLLMVLFLLIAGRTFAQFTVDGAVSTSFNGITPSIGIGVEFSKFDLLAGFKFWISNRELDYDRYQNLSNIGIYIGLAPKTSQFGKWLLSFPLYAEVAFGRSDGDLSDRSSSSNFYFKAGARAAYSFSNHWSLFTGFLINAVSWTGYDREALSGYSSYETTFNVFDNGAVQLGIIYRFNPKNNYTGGSSENDDWW